MLLHIYHISLFTWKANKVEIWNLNKSRYRIRYEFNVLFHKKHSKLNMHLASHNQSLDTLIFSNSFRKLNPPSHNPHDCHSYGSKIETNLKKFFQEKYGRHTEKSKINSSYTTRDTSDIYEKTPTFYAHMLKIWVHRIGFS